MNLLTIPEVADILRVPIFRAYELARSGYIPVCKLGRQVRVDESKLREWIENGGKPLSGYGGWKKDT